MVTLPLDDCRCPGCYSLDIDIYNHPFRRWRCITCGAFFYYPIKLTTEERRHLLSLVNEARTVKSNASTDFNV